MLFRNECRPALQGALHQVACSGCQKLPFKPPHTTFPLQILITGTGHHLVVTAETGLEVGLAGHAGQWQARLRYNCQRNSLGCKGRLCVVA